MIVLLKKIVPTPCKLLSQTPLFKTGDRNKHGGYSMELSAPAKRNNRNLSYFLVCWWNVKFACCLFLADLLSCFSSPFPLCMVEVTLRWHGAQLKFLQWVSWSQGTLMAHQWVFLGLRGASLVGPVHPWPTVSPSEVWKGRRARWGNSWCRLHETPSSTLSVLQVPGVCRYFSQLPC